MSDLRRPLGRVLVAVDLSTASAQVLERAARLRVTPGSELSILHVVPERSLGTPEEREPAMARARRELERQAAHMAPMLADGVSYVVSVVVGAPFLEIVRRAHEEPADLVVLGRHGHRTFTEALLGSTTERVVRSGSTPVLIVNQDAQGGYRRALVAVDLSDTSRAATEIALRLLEPHGGQVRVLHADDGRAWDVTSAILRFLEPYENAGIRWDVVDRRGDPRSVILGDAEVWKPDLLVLGTHGHSKITQQLLGSVAEAVVRGARCDVLVAGPRT
jgi:universal stress protein E